VVDALQVGIDLGLIEVRGSVRDSVYGASVL